MKGRRPEQQEVLTGELMLAKSVIEEKNEILDRKDRTIRELLSRVRTLEGDSEELRLSLARALRREEMVRAEEQRTVVQGVVSEVVRLAAEYEDVHGSSSTGLASRIYGLFRERYDLQVISTPPASVNPQLHQVVEVEHGGHGEGGIEVLSNGYRLGESVIRPALVKVVLGVQERVAATQFRIARGERE